MFDCNCAVMGTRMVNSNPPLIFEDTNANSIPPYEREIRAPPEETATGKPCPVTRISVFLLLEVGVTLRLRGVMFNGVDAVRP